MNNAATVKVILYKQKTLSDGGHPIMLQVIKDRKVRRISIGYSAKLSEWDAKNNQPSKRHPLKFELETAISTKVAELKRQVLALDTDNTNYTADTVIHKVKRKASSTSVIKYFDERIEQLKKANSIGNAEVYQLARNVIYTFCNGKEPSFKDINYTWLKRFETECLSRGNKPNTIAHYLRTLRALFNIAAKEKIISRDVYPFTDYQIGKLKASTPKRAIKSEQIQAIGKLDLDKDSRLFRSKMIFMFSFYTVGTNISDIAKLKWSDIIDGKITYNRSKTHKAYRIALNREALAIVEHYRSIQHDAYIFPIYDEAVHITAQQQSDRLHKVTVQTNRDLREIASMCGINEPLTTYVARHSAATILKYNGQGISVIKELLGHSSEQVTQIYLSQFEDKVLDAAVHSLSNND